MKKQLLQILQQLPLIVKHINWIAIMLDLFALLKAPSELTDRAF